MFVPFRRPRGTATDMVRLGFNNMVANWQALLLRGAEKLLAAAAGLGLVAAVGFSNIDLSKIGRLMEDLWKRYTALSMLVIVAAVLLIIAVAMIVDAFVSAANIRVYLDGYRAALQAMPRPPVAAFRVFRLREWIAGGRAGWWRVFQVDLVIAVISLSPALLLAGTFLPGPHSVGSTAISCLAIVILMITLLYGWLVSMKSEVVCIAIPEASVRDSLHIGWSELKGNFDIHFVTALIPTLIVLGIGIILAIAEKVAGIDGVGSWAQDIATPVTACWFLASFVALTERVLPAETPAPVVEPTEVVPPSDVPPSLVEPAEGELPTDTPP
jgi:hypothetical protein